MPVAEFSLRAVADEAWAALDAAGIPASVVTDPASLGAAEVTRVYVARISAEEAQRVIAAIVKREA